ncbi:hypothetical protein [Novosphingobium sp. TCA1]|jgi:hypothetical protein|uniref:hypothetical protein n=1 Tax=Novosphingobium sp. TCA1 TaxID=2682474 RepID=UPI0013080D67|nr:hypothetical protein [Novosphingobium sp. TCA1]GFE72368.1 hypothetical protein NTCA1_00170 [Novosphingobium sp. TCA1]
MDWGSVPDWIAGIGGLLSIGATGWIAVNERKRANRLEEIQADTEAVQRGAAIDEAQRITAQIVDKYQALSQAQTFADMEPYDLNDYREAIDVQRQQLASLQNFAGTNAQLFVALRQLADAAEMPISGIRTMGQHRFTATAQAGLLRAKSEELNRLR